MALTAGHVVTFDGIVEEEEVGQLALELSYIGRQVLEEDPYRTVSRPYVVVGFLAMKHLGSRTTVFVNAENLLGSGSLITSRWFGRSLLREDSGRWTP